jgi:hypothetical protein
MPHEHPSRTRTAFRKWMLALVLILPGPALAADLACAQPNTLKTPAPAKGSLPELEVLVVTPGKPTSRTGDLGAWLKRLEGQFRYEGYVDLCGNGNATDQRPVSGKADCVSLYNGSDESRRSLYCVIDVRWPPVLDRNGAPVMGGESHLSPAVITYGVVPDLPGIQFMQMDSKGMATHARGSLTGDTLTTTGSCGVPGSCRKVTRITAQSDSQDVAMLIDFEVDSHRVLRHAFLLHRTSNIQMSRTRHDALARDELLQVGER